VSSSVTSDLFQCKSESVSGLTLAYQRHFAFGVRPFRGIEKFQKSKQKEANKVANAYDSVSGFVANYQFGQNNAGLGVYISPGSINGVSVFGGSTFSVAANAVTYFWADASGEIFSGVALPNAGATLTSALFVTLSRWPWPEDSRFGCTGCGEMVGSMRSG
jgi:hypothetical protein